jgi:hypothetical protein
MELLEDSRENRSEDRRYSNRNSNRARPVDKSRSVTSRPIYAELNTVCVVATRIPRLDCGPAFVHCFRTFPLLIGLFSIGTRDVSPNNVTEQLLYRGQVCCVCYVCVHLEREATNTHTSICRPQAVSAYTA